MHGQHTTTPREDRSTTDTLRQAERRRGARMSSSAAAVRQDPFPESSRGTTGSGSGRAGLDNAPHHNTAFPFSFPANGELSDESADSNASDSVDDNTAPRRHHHHSSQAAPPARGGKGRRAGTASWTSNSAAAADRRVSNDIPRGMSLFVCLVSVFRNMLLFPENCHFVL